MAFGGYGAPCKQGVYYAAQIGTGHRHPVSRAGWVKLAAVHRFGLGIKHAEVRGTSRVVGLGHSLTFVVEVRETEAVLFGQCVHMGHVVLRIVDHVVGRNGHKTHAFGVAFFGKGYELLEDVNHKRTVVAHEYHHRRRSAKQVFGRNGLAADHIGQCKCGGGEPKGNGSGWSCSHRAEVWGKTTTSTAPLHRCTTHYL